MKSAPFAVRRRHSGSLLVLLFSRQSRQRCIGSPHSTQLKAALDVLSETVITGPCRNVRVDWFTYMFRMVFLKPSINSENVEPLSLETSQVCIVLIPLGDISCIGE